MGIGCVEIKTFEAVGINGSSELTVTGLPTDGSLQMAFVTLDPAFASYPGNVAQRLAYFNGGNGSGVSINIVGGGAASAFLPVGWTWV